MSTFACCDADPCKCASPEDPDLCECVAPPDTPAGDDVARCTKCGALLDVVEEPEIPPASPRGRLLPNEDRRFELILADGDLLPSIVVGPGAEVTVCRELEADALPFRPNLIEVVPAEDWLILGLRFGHVEELAPTAIPAVLLHPLSCPGLTMSTVIPGQMVTLRARNISSEPRRMIARLLGVEIIPRPDGPLERAVRELAARAAARVIPISDRPLFRRGRN